MELIVIWLLFAGAVGYGAAQKGRSGFAWFVLAVLLSPLLAGLFVLAMRADPKPVAPVVVKEPQKPDLVTMLGSLADLHDRGALTDEEYETRKRGILSAI